MAVVPDQAQPGPALGVHHLGGGRRDVVGDGRGEQRPLAGLGHPALGTAAVVAEPHVVERHRTGCGAGTRTGGEPQVVVAELEHGRVVAHGRRSALGWTEQSVRSGPWPRHSSGAPPPAQSPCRACRRRPTPTRALRAGARRGLRARLDPGRPRLRASPSPVDFVTANVGREPVARRPGPRRRAARDVQRLPASRLDDPRGHRPDPLGHAVSLPRLDLRARRPARGGAVRPGVRLPRP